MTRDELLDEIRHRIAREFGGSHKVFAAWVGMHPTNLSHTLAGDRAPTKALVHKLGYRQVITYEKVWAAKARHWLAPRDQARQAEREERRGQP